MAYDIELKSPNLDSFDRKLDQSLTKVERLSQGMQSLGEQSYTVTARNIPAGPFTRLETVQAKMAAIGADGSSASKDLSYSLKRAELAAAKAEKFGQPLSRGEAMNELLMSSRISLKDGGVSMMPLVNRMMSYRSASALFGESIGGNLAGMAVPLGAASAAIFTLTQAAHAFGEVVRDVTGTYYTGGGGSAGTGKAMGAAAMLGMSGGDFANQAVGFGSTLRKGGYGSAYFRSKGLVDYGVYQTDKTTNFVKALDILRNEPNESTAIRVARDAGLSDYLWLRGVDEGTYQSVINAYGPVSGGAMREGANYRAKIAGLGMSGGIFPQGVGYPLGHLVMDQVMPNKIDMLTPFGPLGTAIRDMIRDSGYETIGLPMSFGGTGKGSQSATKELSNAASDLQDAARTLKENAEQIGGGPRAHGAIPAGWKYLQMDEALTSGAVGLLGATNI